jgi:hypothetical protein
MYCTQCGNQTNGSPYCSACGKATDSPLPAPAPLTPVKKLRNTVLVPLLGVFAGVFALAVALVIISNMPSSSTPSDTSSSSASNPVDAALYSERPKGFTEEQCQSELNDAIGRQCGVESPSERPSMADRRVDCQEAVGISYQKARITDQKPHTCISILAHCPNTGTHATCFEGECGIGCDGPGGKDN